MAGGDLHRRLAEAPGARQDRPRHQDFRPRPQPEADRKRRPGVQPENIRAAIEGSLARQQTDYVDLYQLHWPDRNTPIFGQYQFDPEKERAFVPLEETLAALAELVKEGRARWMGLCNETPWGVMQFLHQAGKRGLPRVGSVRNARSLLNRTRETGLAEIGFRENAGLLAYSPAGVRPAVGQVPGECTGPRPPEPGPGFWPAVAGYVELVRGHGLAPTQLAPGFVASTIIGATTLAQLGGDIAACKTSPADEVLRQIEALHLRYRNPAPYP